MLPFDLDPHPGVDALMKLYVTYTSPYARLNALAQANALIIEHPTAVGEGPGAPSWWTCAGIRCTAAMVSMSVSAPIKVLV